VVADLKAKRLALASSPARANFWLEKVELYSPRSLQDREPFLVFLALDPEYDPLRGDSRFEELVARLDRKAPLGRLGVE
jgi:hypothetical protein